MDLEKRFSNENEIKEWAKEAFWGGFDDYVFTSGQREFVVVVGMPTSGIVTSQVIVLERDTEMKFRLFFATRVIEADVKVVRDQRGIVLSDAKGTLLILPFE